MGQLFGNDSGSRDHALAHGVEDQFRNAVEVELLQEIAAVGFDGVHAETEGLGDVFVALTFGDELKHLPFARGEEFVAVLDAAIAHLADVVFDEEGADRRAEEGFAGMNGADCGHEIRLRRFLDEVAASAGFQRAKNVGFITVHAEHDDPGLGKLCDDLASSFGSIEPGHAYVGDNDVWTQFFDEAEQLAPVGGFGDNLEVALPFEQQLEASAEDDVVIGKCDTDHCETASFSSAEPEG